MAAAPPRGAYGRRPVSGGVLGRLLGGLVAAALVAWLAWRRGSLAGDGAVAAVAVGTVVVAAGGWWWGVLVVVFFASSSALSRRAAPRAWSPPAWSPRAWSPRAVAAPEPGGEVAARGSRRDAVQVLANGGVPAACALVAPWLGDPAPAYAAAAGALATAAADTWATELGAGSRALPRLITTGRRVPPGTSGGVTPRGTLASAAGALTVAAVAALGAAVGWAPAALGAGLLPVVAAAGLAGSLADSLLGAAVQVAYRCPRCGVGTERRIHGCGTPTVQVQGVGWVDNDVVNGAATLVGGGLVLLTVWVLAA